MHRGWLRVLGTPILALWFALVVGEPPWLIACPVHTGHGAPAAASQHTEALHDAPAHDDAVHHCLCVGDCCATAGSVAPPARAHTLPLVAADELEPQWRPAAYRPVAVAHALPFANGPPTAHPA